MCGIVGLAAPDLGLKQHHLTRQISQMTDVLQHRGPDGRGIWVDGGLGLGLGHRRLSIIDLSSEGTQPMVSSSGRFVMVYNGEVYNFPDLRKTLEGLDIPWRGESDSEVILELIEAQGLEAAVRQFNGMFALAVWDRRRRTLSLARDRLGQKPLYYGWSGGALLFGSELKALKTFEGFRGEIDRESLVLYLRHGYVPSPRSIHRGIFKLPAGTLLTIPYPLTRGHLPEPVAYWSPREIYDAGTDRPLAGSDAELITHTETLLKDAVRLRMVGDVPIGAMLSGGIDSSLVVALMQAQSTRAVKTFSIGFEVDGFNEAELAKAVAQHLETDHTELYVSPQKLLEVIPAMPRLYDEPFGDSSQIPTWLVSQLAREQVTVCLTGDGGDESFGGYSRYAQAARVWRVLERVPRRLRRLISACFLKLTPTVVDPLMAYDPAFLPDRIRAMGLGNTLVRSAPALAAATPYALYHALVSAYPWPAKLVQGAQEPDTLLSSGGPWTQAKSFRQQMMCVDSATYLPDDILTKVDRATMGISLEGRAPLLDHRLVAHAARLPPSLKERHGKGKWVLRQVLGRYVPNDLFERPKKGFSVPVAQWLRGPLRAWAEALLHPDRVARDGFLVPEEVTRLWHEHQDGRRNWQAVLWNILMFQIWLDQWHQKPD